MTEHQLISAGYTIVAIKRSLSPIKRILTLVKKSDLFKGETSQETLSKFLESLIITCNKLNEQLDKYYKIIMKV